MNYNELFIEPVLPETLTKEELTTCFIKYQAGDIKYRNIIIEHNIRLAISVVLKKFSNTNYELSDLISLGLIGLIKSVDAYDLAKNVEFSTFATRCINNEINLFLRRSQPTVDSLDIPLDNDNTTTFKDTLIDPNIDFTEESITKIYVDDMLSILSPSEKEIITLYYGLNNKVPLTKPQIANLLNMPTSEVKKTLINALNKLRTSMHIKKNIISRNNGKLKSIYAYLSDYSKEEIDSMLKSLNTEELELINLRYGTDLNNPKTNPNWTEQNRRDYYNKLAPKMRKLLKEKKL